MIMFDIGINPFFIGITKIHLANDNTNNGLYQCVCVIMWIIPMVL